MMNIEEAEIYARLEDMRRNATRELIILMVTAIACGKALP